MPDRVYIVIPAKNEAPRIGKVLDRLSGLGYNRIIVVDDGSTDRTGEIAGRAGATVLRHAINLGPGAATQTGITYAVGHGAEVIVTLDADSQHSPEEIAHLVTILEEKDADVVIGSRFLKRQHGIPVIRRFFNQVANLFTLLYTGVWMSDSQSGFKVMHRRFASNVNLMYNGFEFCTEFVHQMKTHGARFVEEPISVMYSKETMEKGQSFWNGIRMVLTFLRREL